MSEIDEFSPYATVQAGRFRTNRYPGFIGAGVGSDGNRLAAPALTSGSMQPDGATPISGYSGPPIPNVDVPRPRTGLDNVVANGTDSDENQKSIEENDRPFSGLDTSTLLSIEKYTDIGKEYARKSFGAAPLAGIVGLGSLAIGGAAKNEMGLRKAGEVGHFTNLQDTFRNRSTASDNAKKAQDFGPSSAPGGSPDPFGGPTDGGSTSGDSTGGYDPGGYGDQSSGGGEFGGFAHGGAVTADRLQGPNPPGPDDGLAGLDIGEYVIPSEIVRVHGKEFFEKLRAGIIPPNATQFIAAMANDPNRDKQLPSLAAFRAVGPNWSGG